MVVLRRCSSICLTLSRHHSTGGPPAPTTTSSSSSDSPACPTSDLVHKELLECLAKLSAHATIDAKIERIGQANTEVHHQDGRLHDGVVEEIEDCRRNCVENGDDAKRQLHCEKYLRYVGKKQD